MLGLHFCARAFSSCSERGPLFIAVHGPLTVAAFLVVEHKLQPRRLSSCGSRGIWDLPRPGLEPLSPALAGRFSTTAPPGKPLDYLLNCLWCCHVSFYTTVSSSFLSPLYRVRIKDHGRSSFSGLAHKEHFLPSSNRIHLGEHAMTELPIFFKILSSQFHFLNPLKAGEVSF